MFTDFLTFAIELGKQSPILAICAIAILVVAVSR